MEYQIVESERESSAESSPECNEVVSSQESHSSFQESQVSPYDYKRVEKAEGNHCMVFTGPFTDIKKVYPEEPFSDQPVLGVKVREDYLIAATGHVDADIHASANGQESNGCPG